MKGMLALFIGSAAPWRWHFRGALALRQQLTTLQRMTKRLAPSDTQPPVLDRHGRMWGNWRTALVLVQPDNVERWHRDWLRRRWARRSRSRPDGRSADQRTSPTDGGSEPAMGSTANSWSAHQASTLTSQNARSRAGLRRHPRPLADLSDFRCSTADPPSSSFPRPRS